jgi:hypothetical protein
MNREDAKMRSHKLEYHELAIMQIEEAIGLYDKGTLAGFISACTLAHAASGILEMHPVNNKQSFEKIKIDLATKNSIIDKEIVGRALNFFPNSLKHYIEDFCDTESDPFHSAQASILRAILALQEIKIEKTKIMNDWGIKIKELRSNEAA